MNAPRDYWIEQGVPAAHLDELALFAPVEQWDITWECTLSNEEQRRMSPDEMEVLKRTGRRGKFLTEVKCPKCGGSVTCHLNAVSDFYHDDGSGELCYDYQNDPDGLLPSPA